MFIRYTLNGRPEKAAAWSRMLAFLWAYASEGEDINVLGYEMAPSEASR